MARTIEASIDRQAVLYDTTKDLRFILTESVLRWRMLPAPMMTGQLDRIISASRLPNVDIRIVPLSARQRDVAGHSLVIRDDRMVTVETTHAEIVVTAPKDVALYVSKFDRFASLALADDEARAILAEIRDEFLRERETG